MSTRFPHLFCGLVAVCCGACAPGQAPRARVSAAIFTPTFMHTGLAAGPVVFTDSAGHVIEERRYELFGVPVDARAVTETGGTSAPPDFVDRDLNLLNKRTEPSSGWSDHGARWFLPETARWATPDPAVVGPDSRLMVAPWALHPYEYVQQNPSVYWDPDGREPRSVEAEVVHAYQELSAQGPTSWFDAIGVVVEGWKIVVTDTSRRVDKRSYDALVGGQTAADAINSVLRVAGDTPIQRLYIDDHGYNGYQTLIGDRVFDASAETGVPMFDPLLKLAGKFAPGGVLVLGGCNLFDGDDRTRHRTIEGLQKLSTALHVEVRAGTGIHDVRDDELRFPDVIACRGDRCVTANGEQSVLSAWRDQR